MIISNKIRVEALTRIAVCQVITANEVKDVESYTRMTECLAELAYYVGGKNGIEIVMDAIHQISEDLKEDGAE